MEGENFKKTQSRNKDTGRVAILDGVTDGGSHHEGDIWIKPGRTKEANHISRVDRAFK